MHTTVNRRRLSIFLQYQPSVTCGAIPQPAVHLLTLKHWPSKLYRALPCTVHCLALHNWACSVWEPGATQDASQGQLWREISISGGAFDHKHDHWSLLTSKSAARLYINQKIARHYFSPVFASQGQCGRKKSAKDPHLRFCHWVSDMGQWHWMHQIIIQERKLWILIISTVPVSDLNNICNHITPNRHLATNKKHQSSF